MKRTPLYAGCVLAAGATFLIGDAGAQSAPIVNGDGGRAPTGANVGNRNDGAFNASGRFGDFGTDTVLSRSRPGYDALGLRIGAFQLYPSIGASAFYDTNIYAVSRGAVDDAALLLTPRLLVNSNWSSNFATLLVDGNVSRYASRTIENSEAVSGTASGRYDLNADTQITSQVTLARRIQQRGTEDETLVGNGPPVAYGELSGRTAVEKRIGSLLLDFGATARRFRYEDAKIGGARVSLRANNYREIGGNARAGLAIGPGIGVFVAGTANDAAYTQDTTTVDRSSRGYSVLGGVAFGLTRLLTGEVGFGYLRQNFADARYGDISGLDYSGRLNWSPTQLIDVHLIVGRSFQRSALLGAAGIRLDSATASAEYELLRNLILNGALTYTVNDYRGLDRRERRGDGTVGARYLVNRTFSLVAAVAGSVQRRAADSTVGRRYDKARVSAGVRVQL